MTITLPNLSQGAGIPSQWDDTISATIAGLITGSAPAVLTQDLVFATGQEIDALTPVGYDADKELVPATDDVGVAVAASQLLTFSGVGTADDTITVDDQVYTLKASVTTTARQVKIGASAAATANNLIAAINADPAGSGSTFGSATTEHPTAWARLSASGVVEVVAKTPGTAGNALATTEAGSNTSFGAATMAGGKDAYGVKALGITVIDVDTTGGAAAAPVYRGGCFNPDLLNWPDTLDTDAKKFAAFDGAPTPTNIIMRRPAMHTIG